MKRNLKVLGLTLAAVFAMSAVVASAAMAESHFESPSFSGPSLSGNQTEKNVFTIGSSGHVECNKAHFEGMTEGNTQTAVVVHPSYSECSFPPFGEATVTTTGCNYKLFAATTAGMGLVNVECSGGPITIAAAGCTVSVASQNGLNGVHYTNEASGVNVKATVASIAYTKSGSSCFLISGSASYTGAVLEKGYEATPETGQVEVKYVE